MEFNAGLSAVLCDSSAGLWCGRAGPALLREPDRVSRIVLQSGLSLRALGEGR